jgi:ABC-type bacteriocin/lantibiotic exporter with double-glycine peptidase domain
MTFINLKNYEVHRIGPFTSGHAFNCFFYRFKEKLSKARTTGIKRGIFTGLGNGIMWFIIYCSYAVVFWYGVTLILESRENGDHEYTPGILVIVSISFTLLIDLKCLLSNISRPQSIFKQLSPFGIFLWKYIIFILLSDAWLV